MKVPVHSDYANWIQRIWQKQVEFPDLVTYASQPDFSPSLAAVLYQTWLKRNLSPFNAFAWFNLGVLLFSEKDFAGAQAAYESALAIKPDLVSARFNLGLVFERLGKTEEAIEQWKTVEETAKPEISDEFAVLISALNSTGRLQETLKQYQPACAALEKSLLLKPAQKDVIHHLIFMRQKQCQWPIYAPVGDTNEDTLRNGTSALAMLNVSDDPATQLEAALSYSRAKILANLPSLAPTHGYRHDKIRIAYCSGDFCTHPVAMLMVELLEEHDREKFEIYAFCWSPNDGSGLRQRVIQGVNHYIPIHELSEADSARLIREHEIDILVDLHGQTNNARIQMLAHRPAPIQITYLGLPATTGLPCIDYVVADRFLIPEEHAGCYSEKPLYMPDVYQVSDRKRAIGKTPTRTDCGLPDDKFVFCSFNNNHKYTLEVFTVWMNILRQVPDSVLWLLADNPWSRANLLKQAEAQGIDPNRLFFAERALPADYLARYHVADLFLDTFPFNAGTTANDALWMELPVLTMSGRSFAARMAGALLTAAGLPELITYDLKTYESKAIKLAKDARALKRLRKKLADAKTKSPLFNTTQFARNLETHYIELVTAFDQQTATTRPARQVAPASKPLQKTKQLIEIATEAEQFQAQGDIASAIQIYRQWIKQSRSQDKWVAWFNLGALLNNNGDLTGAEQAFQAVLELQPNFAPAKAALGKLSGHVAVNSSKHEKIISLLQTNSPVGIENLQQTANIFPETFKTKLLVEGWRGINHSYALVNQYHLYEWIQSSQLHIYHRDMPLLFAHWETNKNKSNTGLPESYNQQLARIQHWSGRAAYDACFRIHSPVTLEPGDKHPVSTFLVTELGLGDSQIAQFKPNLKDYFNMGGNIVTPSHWSKERIAEVGIPAEHIHIIPHGAASNIFYPMHSDERASHRQSLGFDREAVIFLNVAAPFWNKGLDLLIQAFVQCFRKHPHTRLLIKDQQAVYGVSTKDTVLQEIAQLGESRNESLLNAIRFIPDLNLFQLRQLYCIADYYVSPYRAEGFNLPVIEALACGTPAIVTEGGATQDFCNKKNALFIEAVPHRNVKINGNQIKSYQAPILDSLIEHLNTCVQAKPFSESQRLKNAAATAKSFSWAKSANAILELLLQPENRNTSLSDKTGAPHEELQCCN
ncbi:O-linked N-acetylglucosamine transferase family protein [Nitrosomonas sp.]|uniref:O-linked N-acetylglucosamine transferase family protein n=1 Tax=Nitrosomonas sp. TaxID=42353 RepID=UPI0025D9622E|nr:tetratricopeptide repeat protein [Nitrosomonas sp.]